MNSSSVVEEDITTVGKMGFPLAIRGRSNSIITALQSLSVVMDVLLTGPRNKPPNARTAHQPR